MWGGGKLLESFCRRVVQPKMFVFADKCHSQDQIPRQLVDAQCPAGIPQQAVSVAAQLGTWVNPSARTALVCLVCGDCSTQHAQYQTPMRTQNVTRDNPQARLQLRSTDQVSQKWVVPKQK